MTNITNAKIIATGNFNNVSVNINNENKVNITNNNDNIGFLTPIYSYELNKVIIAYCDGNNEYSGNIVIGTVKGNSIEFSEPIVFNNKYTDAISIIHIPNSDKIVVAFTNGDNHYYATIMIGTIKENTIEFSKQMVFNDIGTNIIKLNYDPDSIKLGYDCINNKLIIVCTKFSGMPYTSAIIAEVNDDGILFNKEIIFSHDFSSEVNIVCNPTNRKIEISYYNFRYSFYGKVFLNTAKY